jgi:hypothetical protein
MLQGMILRQLGDPVHAVADEFSGDNEPLRADPRGPGKGLLLQPRYEGTHPRFWIGGGGCVCSRRSAGLRMFSMRF